MTWEGPPWPPRLVSRVGIRFTTHCSTRGKSLRVGRMSWIGGIEVVECVADSRRRWLDVKLPSAVQVLEDRICCRSWREKSELSGDVLNEPTPRPWSHLT